jgi:hypothetical protein
MSTVPEVDQLELVRTQLDEGQRFWAIAEELAQVSDELSRERMAEHKAEARATAKKKGSKRSLLKR